MISLRVDEEDEAVAVTRGAGALTQVPLRRM